MNTPLPQRSVVAVMLAWLRGHMLFAVFGVFTALALAVAAAQSLLAGSVLPLVLFLIFSAFIVPGVLRLTTGGHDSKGENRLR